MARALRRVREPCIDGPEQDHGSLRLGEAHGDEGSAHLEGAAWPVEMSGDRPPLLKRLQRFSLRDAMHRGVEDARCARDRAGLVGPHDDVIAAAVQRVERRRAARAEAGETEALLAEATELQAQLALERTAQQANFEDPRAHQDGAIPRGANLKLHEGRVDRRVQERRQRRHGVE